LGTRELKNIQNQVELYRVVSSAMSKFEKEVLDPRRVAVLPLANMSPDPNDRYFAEGMTEELISTISKVGELSVISRTSVMRYKDTTLSIGQIAQELAAGSIVEGSIRKAGNRVRITAQLIQAESDRHVWSQSYDRDLTDVFAIQGDIAEKVAEALKVQLLSKEKKNIEKKATSSPEAYTLYLKGRHFWNERTEAAVKKAIQYFEQAVKIDPNFAMAYSGLADSYLIMSDYYWMDPPEAGLLAKGYATRALEIDDALAEAHASLGLFHQQSWEFSSAERELKRAIELKPNYPASYHWYAIQLSFLNKFEDAGEMLKRAIDLDPYSRILNLSTGASLFYLRRYEQAIEQLDNVIESNPDFAAPHLWKSAVCVQMHKFADAIEEGKKSSELDNGSSNTKLNLAWIYASAGDKESAVRMMDEAMSKKKGYISPAQVGTVKFLLGQKDEAFALFQKALESRDSTLLYLRGSPTFEECQSDPRWREIERNMGLPKS
jgi:TolB-like protein/Flp pilus assembly protein TadD